MRKRSRDQYLRLLAAEPLFADVPRQLIPVVGRAVEVLDLRPGAAITITAAKETLIILQGLAVAQDDEHQANAVVGPHMVTDPARADADGLTRLTAITRLHCVVIPRRDLNGLLAMAPTLARRLTSAADTTPYGAVRRAQTRAPRGRTRSAIEQKSRGASNGSNVDRRNAVPT